MIKRNYQKEMEEILKNLQGPGATKRLLLHSCCAPCSSYVLMTLSRFFNITIFYYNPNISPKEEYDHRKDEQKKLLSSMDFANGVNFLDCDYEDYEFDNISKGLENEPEKGRRCYKCYELRLRKTAQKARVNNYDFFATTLTVSPYKNADWINKIGEDLSRTYGVAYLVSDFKKNNGYKKSIELSEKYNLYRQNFCGCRFSRLNMI
ncbi:MAG: epoxyqueuosine reductase QueH [Clostridia bacterium]|nr:epoxyqueuosine reductase QueH [Clostridia bacterium]